MTNAGKGVKKICDISYKTISTRFNAIKSSFKRSGTESVQAGIQTFKNEIAEKFGSRVTGYTKHGLQQAIGRNEGRGVSPNIILDILKNPKKTIDHGDSIKFVEKNGGGVVVNLEGKIITTFGSSRGPKIWDWGKYK